MAEEFRCYITLNGVTQVLRAEKALQTMKEKFVVVPIPREITADCGMCVMCLPEDADKIIELLKQSGVVFERVYSLKRKKTGLLRKMFDS